jgi:hypothetical protein
VLHDPRREEGFVFLHDLRRATAPVDTAAAAHIVDAIRTFWPHLQPSRGAVLLAHQSESVAVAVHALADRHGLPVRMFTSCSAALNWLQDGA